MNAKIDPIIAVNNVEASSRWYQSVLGCRSIHGGTDFEILVSDGDEILLCLHKWGEHGHPTMTNPPVTPGNGLILYFRTENINAIRQKVNKWGYRLKKIFTSTLTQRNWNFPFAIRMDII